MELFLRMRDEDMIQMGIDELGSRKKLTQAIMDIHKQDWKTGSLPDLQNLEYIS